MTADDEAVLAQLRQELAQARRRIAEFEILEQRRKRAQDAVRESEHKIWAVLDQTFQFIGLMEPDGTLIDANRSALEFGGLEVVASRRGVDVRDQVADIQIVEIVEHTLAGRIAVLV